MRGLERYITEGSPKLKHVAEVTAELARLSAVSRSP
jgi:hypothetical protein